MSKELDLHTAVCNAVQLLNVCVEGARIKEVRDAHNILRTALVTYADAFMDEVPTQDEREKVAKKHRSIKP